MPKNFFKAVAVMVGYIIGVGMFGLPYLISRAGILSFCIFLLFIVPTQYFLHLIYANIIISTHRYHRLTGYARIYLGSIGEKIVFIAKMIGSYGALLAYIIITGIFLNQLLSPYFGGNEFIYASILFALEALIVYFGLGVIARAELLMTALLVLIVGMIAWKGSGAIDVVNIKFVDWKYLLIPYGAMLYAFDGGASLPLVAKLIRRRPRDFKNVIRVSSFLAAVIIIIFTLTIVGISGYSTTPDALSGVKMVLDDGVIFFSLIFGVLTMITSFLGVAESIKDTYVWDFGINKKIAYILTIFIPYIMYAVGFDNLISIISFAGAICGGFCGVALILIFRQFKKKQRSLELFKMKPGAAISYFLISVFVLGVIYEVYYFLCQ
jgi:tyrosine-specific transport protein